MSDTQTQAVFDEIRDWFFEGYVPTWVAAGAGSEADPRSVIKLGAGSRGAQAKEVL